MKHLLLTAALAATATNLALAQPAPKPKPKIVEIVIDGVAGFQDTPMRSE